MQWQCNSFALTHDTVWVDMSQVYVKLPVINPDNQGPNNCCGKENGTTR